MPISLSEIVLAEGLVSTKELAAAAALSEEMKCPLVASLVHDHGVDDVAIFAALKKHIRIETLDLAGIEIDSDALRQLSVFDCRRLRALPLSITINGVGPRLLRVAMADPTDTVSLAELDHISGSNIETILMPLSAVEMTVESAYKQFVTEVMSQRDITQGHFKKTNTPSPRERTKKTTRIHAKPSTVPFRRVTDDASLELRMDALVKLAIAKGICTEAEYDETLRALMKEKK